uniref:Uncharacterized protein n=1 Tax=Cacopsylla melanoneura TaxID=428564 RepID=A0A8D8TV21_9HEMI
MRFKRRWRRRRRQMRKICITSEMKWKIMCECVCSVCWCYDGVRRETKVSQSILGRLGMWLCNGNGLDLPFLFQFSLWSLSLAYSPAYKLFVLDLKLSNTEHVLE